MHTTTYWDTEAMTSAFERSICTLIQPLKEFASVTLSLARYMYMESVSRVLMLNYIYMWSLPYLAREIIHLAIMNSTLIQVLKASENCKIDKLHSFSSILGIALL